MDSLVKFGATSLICRHRWLTHVGWISLFVLAHDAIWPEEAKAKDLATPATPEIAASPNAIPEANRTVHGKDWQGQPSTSTGAQIGRGWQPEYDPTAPAGPYGGSTEEATPTAPSGSVPGRVLEPTCMTAFGVTAPCPRPGVPYGVETPRMPRGYAQPYGVHGSQPRVKDNGGGGGRN